MLKTKYMKLYKRIKHMLGIKPKYSPFGLLPGLLQISLSNRLPKFNPNIDTFSRVADSALLSIKTIEQDERMRLSEISHLIGKLETAIFWYINSTGKDLNKLKEVLDRKVIYGGYTDIIEK